MGGIRYQGSGISLFDAEFFIRKAGKQEENSANGTALCQPSAQRGGALGQDMLKGNSPERAALLHLLVATPIRATYHERYTKKFGELQGRIYMSQIPQQLLSEALEMSSPDRGRLAALLIESLEPETDADADQAWSEEIARRLNEIDEGRVKMIPAEEARRIIRGQNGTPAD